MASRGITQSELARRMGTDRATVGRVLDSIETRVTPAETELEVAVEQTDCGFSNTSAALTQEVPRGSLCGPS